MKNYKVSIIVPIYKVEKYLDKCIKSIINQTYKNLEIILVDDGSPDKCGEICDSYAQKDNRIIVIHKKNGGLSDARNEGIKKASGDYIAFIDSDDYITNDYIEYLLNLILNNSGDISIILPIKVDENYQGTIRNKKEKITVYNAIDALIVMLYQKEFDNAAWGKLYSKTVIKDIKFPVGKLYEDIGTTYKYILKSKKVVYSNQQKYYYLQRKDSIMGSAFKKNEMDYVYQSKILLDDVAKLNNSKLNKAAKCRYLNTNFSNILKIGKNEQFLKEKKELKENIKNNRKEVLFDGNARFKTKVAILLSYIGVL